MSLARLAWLAFGPRDGGAQDAQDSSGRVSPGRSRSACSQCSAAWQAASSCCFAPTRVSVVAGLAATAAVAATGASSVASATSVAASSPVPLSGHRQRACVRHDVRFRRLVGGVIRRRFGRRLGHEAGRPAALVAQVAARNSAALIRPLSRPSAASKTSSAERPICAALRSIALMALRLVLGLRRSFSSALRICASWARLKGVLDGHRWRPLWSPAPRRSRRCYHPRPAGNAGRGRLRRMSIRGGCDEHMKA